MRSNRFSLTIKDGRLKQGSVYHDLSDVTTSETDSRVWITASGKVIAKATHKNQDAFEELKGVIDDLHRFRANQKKRAEELVDGISLRDVMDIEGEDTEEHDAALVGQVMEMKQRLQKMGQEVKRQESFLGTLNHKMDEHGEVYEKIFENQEELTEAMQALWTRKKQQPVPTPDHSGVARIEIAQAGEVREIEGLMHEKLPQLIKLVGAREPVCLVGGAGTGKTTATRQAAKSTGLEYTSFRGHRHAVADDLFGFMSAATGEYVPGVAYEPFTEGGLLFIDEFDVCTPSFIKGLNNLTDGSPVVQFPHGMMERHEDFSVVVAANTIGQGADEIYTGASGALDGSSLDRLMFLNWGIDPTLEYKAGLRYVPEGQEENYDSYVSLMRHVREGFRDLGLPVEVTPRAIIKGAKLMQMDFEAGDILSLVLYNRLSEDQCEQLDHIIDEWDGEPISEEEAEGSELPEEVGADDRLWITEYPAHSPINAIKVVRSYTGYGLKEAKELVDRTKLEPQLVHVEYDQRLEAATALEAQNVAFTLSPTQP